MKKLNFYLMIIILSLSFFPSSIIASEKNKIEVTAISNELPAEVKTMLNRLEEIKKIDKSSLSRLQRKELRKEVKAIKENLKSSATGVYISIGAVLVIIFSLMLLL